MTPWKHAIVDDKRVTIMSSPYRAGFEQVVDVISQDGEEFTVLASAVSLIEDENP